MDTPYSARVQAAADRFDSGDSEFAAGEFAALAADVGLPAADRIVMYVNLATVYSAVGLRDEVIAAFDRAIELEQRPDHFARASKQAWLDTHRRTTPGQPGAVAGPFRASYFGWSVVWQASAAWAVLIATVLILSAVLRGNVGVGDVLTGVAITAVFGAAMIAIHTLVRRQWITFDGPTVIYRPAIGRRRRFTMRQVDRVRRKNSRLGPYFAITLASGGRRGRRVTIPAYAVANAASCSQWLQRLAQLREVDLDLATTALLQPWR
ncbi:MAG: hypothetical protein M3Y77_05690 [Actinomycetota bacterium]|nr:hypothetical protein [Actinomycetota bacterium]